MRKNLKKNSIFLLFLILGIGVLFFLSRVVFSVSVIHQDKEIREFVRKELENRGIYKYTLRKNYYELEKIEDDILTKNKDILEWIEISFYGTKCIVRFEERKKETEEEVYQYQDIVSKKDAVLTEVYALSGEKVHEVNEYVRKGDVVISGGILHPSQSKSFTMARGHVYGEVWYSVDIEYPFVYQETNLTGRSKTVYSIRGMGFDFGLFQFHRYKSFQSKDKVLLKSNFLGIEVVKSKQYEAVVKDEVYTEDMVRDKAISYVSEKLSRDNPDFIRIKDVKILDSVSNEIGISYRMFVRVIEDIGEVREIREEDLEDNGKNT